MKIKKTWHLVFGILVLIIFSSLCIVGYKVGSNYIDRRLNGVAKGVYLENINMEGYLRKEVTEIVELLAIDKTRKPQNAGINKKTGEIIPSKEGVAVDEEKTIGLVLYSSENTHLNLILYTVKPDVSTEDLGAITTTLGSYATWFSGSTSRYHNVKLATLAINNTLVLPNEVFSFNLTTGKRSIRNGYQPAPVIMGSARAMGIGGGVCQVSSTLYNAVQKSELKIIERHPHSLPVRYVPPNKDAAVAEGAKDFRFQNNRSSPIIIKAALYGTRIDIRILGKQE